MIEGWSRRVLWAVFLGLLASGLFLVSTSIRTTSASLYVTQQPEAFTELAFSRYTPKKQSLSAGRSYPLAYSLTNRENVMTTYTLETLVTVSGQLQSRHLETVHLKDGERVDRAALLKVSSSGQHFQITVHARSSHGTQTIFARANS